mmetsp:Transcript_11437/g.10246  ORF Transcript_11437/g.10246 Transcript_11437/m.10246 type:complete len:165 (-) Transcript_11437:216-710(-)
MDTVNLSTTSLSANYHPPQHYHKGDINILSTEVEILQEARDQYPMMNVILITVSTVLICLCLLSIKGWKKYFVDKKLDKLESEMDTQRKINSRIFEQDIELTHIHSKSKKSLSLSPKHRHNKVTNEPSPISQCDDNEIELNNNKSSEFVTVIDDDEDEEELIIV